MEYARHLLEEIGLGGERLEMYEIAASDAPKWVAAVTEMTQRALTLGPNPLRRGRKLQDADAELDEEHESMVGR